MKKIILGIFSTVLVFSLSVFGVQAQMPAPYGAEGSRAGMNLNNAAADDHTAKEEAEGKAVWEKLQAKQVNCEDLSDEDFGALGEYFMGQMMGDSHVAMNVMMIQMMGEEGEEAMHIVLGKRLSGCDTGAVFPAGGLGFMPMMQMMGGGGWPSMNFGHGFGASGWISMFFWWILFIAGIVVLIRWLSGLGKGTQAGEVSALEILKQRYARGEIDRKEFEEKLRDLNKT